jgi:cytochrome c biogenesis protein CcdA
VTGLLLPLLGLALLDSLNPSALAVTIYLLLNGGPYARRVLVYLSGVFLAYLSAGALIMLGLDPVSGYFGGPAAYGTQGAVGAAMLLYALLAPGKPREEETRVRQPRSWSLGAIFLLGVTVTAVEFVTAFPYLGAIAILTTADLPAAQWLPILVVYNAIFVLPPLLLLAAYVAFGKRLESHLGRYAERLKKEARETMLWLLGIVGFFLLADALRYFDFFGLL